MADWIYVDNSNVFIEGQRVSAVGQGMALNIFDAQSNRIVDPSYRISFGKLYNFIARANRREAARAMLFRSRLPKDNSIWDIARRAGFEVITHDRNIANKEKKIDTGIVTEMMRDAYRSAKPGDVFAIVSGDSDYVPSVERLITDGFQVDVVFWGHAARELREACSNFVSLNPHLQSLRP